MYAHYDNNYLSSYKEFVYFKLIETSNPLLEQIANRWHFDTKFSNLHPQIMLIITISYEEP